MSVLRSLALASACLLGGCGGGPAIPDADLRLQISLGASEVALGAAFPLTVQRVWSKELLPAAWSDRALAPLALRLERIERREDDHRIEETRHYLGYALSLADLRIAGPKFVARPRAGGPDRIVTAEPLSLRVRRALDPAAPGPPELPEMPEGDGSPWWALLLLPLLAAVGTLVAVRRRPRRPRAASQAHDPASLALPRLHALRSTGDFLELAAIVRGVSSTRFAIRAEEMTTEEILAHGGGDARLGAILRGCDLVKFAGLRPAAAEFAALLGSAEAFVRDGGAP